MDNLKRIGLVFKADGTVDFVKTLKEANLALNENFNQFKLTQAQWDESTTKIDKLRNTLEYLTNAYEFQEDKVTTLRGELEVLESAENKNAAAIKRKRQELLSAEVQLKNYENKVKNATTELKNAENGIKTTAEKIEELTNKLKENENAFKLTQSQYTALTTKSQKLKDEQSYLTNAYELQKEKLELLNQELDELENSEDKNTTAISKKRNQVMQAETELNNYNTKLKIVTNLLESTSAKAVNFGENIEKVGSKIEKAGNKLSAFSTASAGALIYAAKSAIDFEDAFTGVEKTVDATPKQLAAIKQGIIDMSKEIPSSTTEISAVAEAAGQLGIETDNILSFSRAMIDLGNSTNLTSDEAASQLAKFANIMGMSQKDFDRLGSSIVDLGNHFATTEADIVEMAMRLAGAGKQVGLSEGQVLGLATSLSSVGIEAEMGGSAISKAMVKMQNAVDLGGGKMEKVLKKAGMSLHDMELMAANDSKGFKALAGSLDMTSTELKNMITAGTNLEDFAKVSGMTTAQFKKAWKEDAAGALSAFIQGLGHAEDKGESAITMLSEMGLTEVRLRDSLLRAANAGDLFNKALETGTTAWKENTALANEANKRYENLKSKIKIAINQLQVLAITVGNKLMPSIEKGIGKIEEITKKVEGLNDNQVEWIVKTAAVVVAIGPLVKILGTVTSTTGKVVKGFGTFIQAVGVMKGKVTTTSESVNGLAGFLTKLTSPAGIATAAILATAGALVYFATKKSEATKAAEEFANKASDFKKQLDEYNNSVDEAAGAELAHIDAVERLKNELSTLVDENGKVKEGEKSRVQFILNELNSALGTEYSLNGDIIQNYKDLQKEIDGTIEKKRAKIKLDAEESKYKNAIEKQTEAVEGMKKAQQDLGMSYEDAKKKLEDYNKKSEDMLYMRGEFANLSKMEFDRKQAEMLQKAGEIDQLKKNIEAYENYKGTVQMCTNDIKRYEDDYAKYTEGKYEEIGNTIITAAKEWKNASVEEIKNGINEQENALKQYKEIYDRTGSKIANANAEQAKKNLEDLANNLQIRTERLGELGQTEIEAWKNLATQSYNIYHEQLSKMTPEMQKKISDVTGVIYQKTPDVSAATEIMSKEILSRLDNDKAFKDEALKSMYGYLNGLSNSDLRSLLTAAGIQDVDKVMEGIRAGNLAEDEGKKILTSLNNGLNSGAFKGTLFNTARDIASGIANRLSVKFNVSGLNNVFKTITGFLPGHKLGLDYVPKDNYVARLHKGERVLTAEENKEYTEAEEESRKRNSTSVVHTTNVAANNEIVERILETNSKMVTLLQRILETNNKSIVLDTGELVGATADKYNIELERIRRKDERGS